MALIQGTRARTPNADYSYDPTLSVIEFTFRMEDLRAWNDQPANGDPLRHHGPPLDQGSVPKPK